MTTCPKELAAMTRAMERILEDESERFGVPLPSFSCKVTGGAGSRGTHADASPYYLREPLEGELDNGLSFGEGAREYLGFLRDLTPNDELKADLRCQARRHARTWLRLRAVEGHGGITAPWSMTMHVVIEAVLRHEGVDARGIMSRAAPCWTRVRQAIEGHRGLRMSNMATNAGRMLFSGLGPRTWHRNVRLRQSWTMPDRLSMHVVDMTLPDTVLVGIAGMRLGDVVDHPAFTDLPTTIIEAEMDSCDDMPSLRFDLSYDHVAMGKAPVGADVSWLAGDLRAA